jgi:hypothetical protein
MNGERRRFETRPPRENAQVKREQSNIIFVKQERSTKFYVYLVKQLFHNEKYDTVQLHGAGFNIFSVIKVAEIISRFKYADIARIKTKAIENSQMGQKSAKLIITLSKTADFEKLYKEFEESKAKSMEERGIYTRREDGGAAKAAEVNSKEDSTERDHDENQDEVNIDDNSNKANSATSEEKDNTDDMSNTAN